MTLEGQNLTELPLFTANDRAFDLSIDDRITWSSNRDGDREVYLAGLDGSGLTRITNEPGRDEAPAFRRCP